MSTKKAKSKEQGEKRPDLGGGLKSAVPGEDRSRLITPAMAVSGMTGNAEDAPVLPDAGGQVG
ncbi:hypothetical protein OJ996_24585 [Luteolibacter sp. GHJ8]|uniref:Chromosome partitioning protein ParB n=1 Tax=Luteolibacter rhizosphaerae TaxID=2989719 RepID=A0ABT3GAD5_9BACT|nr:hypothetical protein [Luteolibacter rhizosphaerae]MCW1916788.1 hypothetical protein [Luteolibacter rhizosphaerae]